MISRYDLAVLTPPCSRDSELLVAKASFSADIAPVLPYLNATLREATFYPEARSLSWIDDIHTIVFHPHEIAVSDVANREDAIRLIEKLIDLINETWQRRAEIVPSVAVRKRLTPMAVYGLLPRSNCKECGLPGCWQFALRLSAGESQPAECPELARPEFAGSLNQLREMVAAAADR